MNTLDLNLFELFFPRHAEKAAEIDKSNKRFVHYTSAEALLNILKTDRVWLRQPSCMNDYREIHHGFDCLFESYSKGDQRLKKTLDLIDPNLSNKIEIMFGDLYHETLKETYILCVSEHEVDEDEFGRLSMWRAYGKKVGVAVVMNKSSFIKEEAHFKTYVLPVSYSGKNDFKNEIDKITDNVILHLNKLKKLDKDVLIDIVLNMFRFAVLSTKHAGFSEEKEWRVVYSPGIEYSPHLEAGVESIDGVPQEIYKLPLQTNIPNFNNINLNDLINRIIIGPTPHALTLKKTITKLLVAKGVQNVESKIYISDIPIRN